MTPEMAWAIGCFHNGECIGLVRYVYGGRTGEPILYNSREAARRDIEDPCFEHHIKQQSPRPVKVRVEVVK